MSVGIPFGNYRLQRRIARGGMAEVFLALQEGPEGFERQVAVKRILPHLADIPQFQEMFLDEARLAARLSHPNIAHIYEFGSFRDNFFIAMEYIPGVDLGAVVLEGLSQPLPLQHAARVVAEVCSALNYAHQIQDTGGAPLSLVHRDISPQNIMVSFDGAVKVLDFGIAKAAHHVERTQPGVVRGKFSYMSPEQVVGHTLDGRSDLFCAGIVLHELCSAASLFPRTDAVAAMQQIRKEPIPPAMRDGQPVPEELGRVLARALEKDPEDRYPTAADMQLDLERFLQSHGELSNSVLLGRYFSDTYKAGKERQAASASDKPLTEAEVYSTAVAADGGRPRLPRVEISGTLARPGDRTMPETPPAKAGAAGAAPSQPGERPVNTTAGTVELTGRELLPDRGLHEASTATPAAVSAEAERRRWSSPRKALLVGGLAALLIGAGVSAGYLFTPKLEPSGSPPGVAGAHLPRASAPEAEPLPGPLEPLLDIGPSPAVVRLRRPDAGGQAPAPKKANKAVSRSPRPRLPARTRPRSGYLYVSTIPWTQVYLGSRLLGITPLARVALPAGKHRLTLKNPAGIRRTITVNVRQGKSARVRLDLRR